MNSKDFFDKVAKMREMQKQYFKDRSSMSLSAAKRLEKEVDVEIARVKGIVENDGQLKLRVVNEGVID